MLARRPMVWFALACACGMWIGTSFGSSGALAALLLGLLAFVAMLVMSTEQGESHPSASPLAPTDGILVRAGRERVLICIGLIVFGLSQWRAASVWRWVDASETTLERTSYGRLVVDTPPEQGIVTDDPCFWSCTARLVQVNDHAVEPVPVQLSGYGPPGMLRGDELSGTVLRETIRPAAFPGDFDLRQYLAARGLSLSLRFIRDDDKESASPETATPFAYRITPKDGFFPGRWIDSLRRVGIRRVLAAAPGEEGRLLAVVLFGYRVTRADQYAARFRNLRTSFRDVGIGHLLAISGLHVGLVVALAWWVLAWRITDRRVRALLCIAVCLLYLGLSGGRIAAVRASIMTIVYLLGFVMARRSDFPSALALAACGILFVNPPALFDIGFLLSFTAVLFISRLCVELDPLLEVGPAGPDKSSPASPSSRMRDSVHVVGRHARGLLALSVAAWLGVWPLTALAFYQIHPVGLLANVVALPLMSLVLGAGAFVPWVGPLGFVAAFPATVLIAFARTIEHVPGGSIALARPAWAMLAAYYFSFGLLFLRRVVPDGGARTFWTRVALLLILVSTVVLIVDLSMQRIPRETRITLLDSGRDETVVVETPDGRVIALGRLPAGGRSLVRMLRADGRQAVDRVIAFRASPDASPPVRLTSAVSVKSWDVLPYRVEEDDARPYAYWETVDPASATQLAISRDREGRVVCWAVRVEGLTVSIGEWVWAEQMEYRLKQHIPGMDAPLVSLRVRGAEDEIAIAEALPARWVFLGHDRIERVEDGIQSRSSVGAIRLTRGRGTDPRLRVYDGKRWRDVPARRSRLVSPDDTR